MVQAFRSVRLGLTRQSLEHSARTAVAALLALLIARALKSPEAYWAPISTLVVMQSTLGAAWTISRRRFAGTALGAGLGALLVPYLGSGPLVFAIAVFAIGMVCAALRLDKAAYRFAGITLAIVMLVGRTSPAWVIAAHRFLEVALGIAVALGMTAAWPEREPSR
jgi:uncharacterized membrane protein YgaE (UPF0421/DUF939 family)